MKNYVTKGISLILLLIVYSNSKAQYNYAEALQKSMFFYECQESGPLLNSNRVNWRGNSALDDGSDVGHDLTGGWYDAGDHVKFNFPMAYTATVLAWGAIDFEDGYNSTGQMQYLKRNLRWVNDYFIKCHTSPNELWGQVGNGGLDHAWWGSAEVMQMERPAYKIDANNPGSDLAGETAAALAAASIVFQEDDPSYSATLLSHAEQLYSFADNYRGVYSDAITDAAGYYRSYSGYNDELVWGAIWLYRATGDISYLNKAESYYANLGNEGQSSNKAYKWGFAWDDKSYGCYVLLAKITGDTQYKQDAERHLDYWTDGYNGDRINYTPGGLAYLDVWGALRYAINTSFLAKYYADAATSSQKTTKYENFAVNQINYALGSNPRNSSYVCGFGNNPPVNPHHRTAHGCWSNNHNGPPEFTRHTLYGALVGGPNSDDSYEDERSNYTNNEVACDYNACFSGLLAALAEENNDSPLSGFPIPETPQDEYFVEAKLNASGATHTEWAVWVNNHTAWPSRIPSEYKFRLFIDITEGLSAGYTLNDYVVSTNNGSVVNVSSLQPWDTTEDIYYAEVTFNTDIMIWPGGIGESKEEAQIRIRLPYEAPSSAWDPQNDWSAENVDGTLKPIQNIPLYVDGNKVFGLTPDEGPDTVHVTSVELSPETLELEPGESAQLSANVIPSNASNKNVSWNSDNPSIASVDANGLVTGNNEGSAIITVTTEDGDYTASAAITVAEDTVGIPQFTLSTTITGNGSIDLNPAGGVYDSGTVVSLTAIADAGYLFQNWSGDISSQDNPVAITMDTDKMITALFLEDTTGSEACESPTPVTLSFSFDGSGEYCWVTSQNIQYINSWNMQLLEINGVDYTNQWSNSMPARINGNYYIHYIGEFNWSHFEAAAQNARIASISNDRNKLDRTMQIEIYPNPSEGNLNIDLSGVDGNEKIYLTIHDLQGRIVYSKDGTLTSMQTVSTKLKSGIYTINLEIPDGRTINKKIVIK